MLSVERGERDAPSARTIVSDWFSGFYGHDHRGIFLNLSDLAQFHVLRETGHQRRAEARAPQISGAEPREKEEEHATEKNGTHSHTERGQAQSAIQLAVLFRVHLGSGRNRAGGAAPQFYSDEGRNPEQQKNEKKNQKGRVHHKNRRSQNRCKRQRAEKDGVAIVRRAVEAHQHGEDQEMHHGEEQRKKRRIRGAANKEPRKKYCVKREKDKISNQAPGGATVRKFGGFSVPPPQTLVQCGKGSNQGSK